MIPPTHVENGRDRARRKVVSFAGFVTVRGCATVTPRQDLCSREFCLIFQDRTPSSGGRPFPLIPRLPAFSPYRTRTRLVPPLARCPERNDPSATLRTSDATLRPRIAPVWREVNPAPPRPDTPTLPYTTTRPRCARRLCAPQ